MRLNIAYSTDENYVRHLGVSMISLFENNVEFSEIFVYIIENDISNKSKRTLEEISERYNRNLKFISFKGLAQNLTVDDSFSKMSYGRLFLGQINDIDKIIYLDCDSIVAGSFYDLWMKDISDYYIAAVQDTVNSFYIKSIGLSNSNRYINAGFLLVNLKRWRMDNLEDSFINFINEYNGSVPHHDQGTLNAICKDRVLILEPKYNLQCPMFHFSAKQIKKLDNLRFYYTQEQLNDAISEPVFIHFTNGYFNRPWNRGCTHPMAHIYLGYLDKSPWKNSLLEGKLNRNAKIMKFIYENSPFSIYRMASKLITYRKARKLQKQFQTN
ncbi:glycosyltransferase family 8 protein [Mesobacillus maritimus]|uniref:Glycosyltransferase family 8 protein n=1 Tax=Mesobacillus maritimus TaxID=1643336 RepID=A0ABS7K5E7_9BACI|nr:glycosyltransferase family 8 protein [Mesobacillus maritimus]MBY0097325.1 glycosyltransferase family 8 protein [Mesobacillus maritimus]